MISRSSMSYGHTHDSKGGKKPRKFTSLFRCRLPSPYQICASSFVASLIQVRDVHILTCRNAPARVGAFAEGLERIFVEEATDPRLLLSKRHHM